MAGLSAGCFLQKKGIETEIFEMAKLGGGLCTSWKRKGYSIDGCIHWFVGGNPNSTMYSVWNELLDMKKLEINEHEEFCSLTDGDKIIHFYSDLDRLQKEFDEISPADKKATEKMIRIAKRLVNIDFASEYVDFWSKLKLILKLLPLLKSLPDLWGSVEQYAKKFKHPLIRKLLLKSFPSDSPMGILLWNASWFHNKNAGYPVGGPEKLIGQIVKNYESLGGKLHLNKRVTKILVENDVVKGIELDNGEKHYADSVISAADGRTTIFEMLEGKYLDDKIKKYYQDEKYEPKRGTFYVSLGVARLFKESFKPYVIFLTKNPRTIDGKKIENLSVTIHNFDPFSAPEGKSTLTVMVESHNPKYWIDLRKKDIRKYEKEKEEIGQWVINEIDAHFGNIRDNLEMVDVATPATFKRFTGNWNGVAMGWQDFRLFIFRPRKIIRGLKNFYMCGHWVGDAGLPGASQSGKQVAQMVARDFGWTV